MRHLPRNVARTLIVALVAATTLASSAAAQEDGVTLDPSDPAAHEYALPVDSARREATGESTDGLHHGSSNAPSFGEGVSPDRPSGPNSQAGSQAAAASNGTAAGAAPSAADASTAPDAAAGVTAPTTLVAESTGPGTALIVVGGGLAALLIVGIGGLALRATRGPDGP